MSRAVLAILTSATLVLGGSVDSARAAEVTEIASSFDEDDPFDLHLGVDYNFEARRVALMREQVGVPLPKEGFLPLAKDLIFKQRRHVVTPRVAVGLFHDVQLSLAVPIVLTDSRELAFDQGITRDNSSTIASGLLPKEGYDADAPTTNFPADPQLIFRGVDRSGVDQLRLGLTVGLLNQARDDTKPTWVLGAELRLSIGEVMRFSRETPTSETGVSLGVHELRVFTGLSKRTTWAEPFVYFYWQGPLATRGDNPNDPDGSLFWNLKFGQENKTPQHQAGATFGFEAIPWEDKRLGQKIALEFRGRLDARFQGMGYPEIWEVLAYAGESGALALDADPTQESVQALAHPGVTVIENYMTFGGRLGFRGHLGENALIAGAFEIAHDTEHRLTFSDAGTDRDNDEEVDPGTNEVNPLHRPIIDLPGHRFVSADSTIYTFLVTGQIMF
ncbi:MAG: hypothetical protein HY698_06705 [Deltaproteobacteria bacterium]|nr:hypothetical protein [Deltaproteobacteria bacterium]